MLLINALLYGCVEFSPPDKADSSPVRNSENNSLSDNKPRKKFFNNKLSNDFSALTAVSISDEILDNPSVSEVLIQNEDRSFKLLIEKEDIVRGALFQVPLSKHGEKIKPIPIYRN